MALRRVLTVIGLVLCLFILGLAPVAAGPPTPVGDQINLYTPPATFAAGAPFHLTHGWLFGNEDLAGAGLYSFELWLDGGFVPASYKDVEVSVDGAMSMARTVVFNFPEGLSGTHTLTGVWLAPCKFFIEGPCDSPSQQMAAWEVAVTINFSG
jgi:hypothetical protein